MIRFLCNKCGKKLKAEDKFIGRQVKCSRCRNVETVPPFDSLENPKKTRRSTADNDLKPTRRDKSSDRESAPDRESARKRSDQRLARSVGQSGSAATPPSESFQPKFKAKPKRVNLKVWIPIGLVGFGAVAGLLVLFNLNWILETNRKLSTDYEKLPEVVLYRRAAMDLEKSRRMMWVTGRAYITSKSAPQVVSDELNEFNDSIKSLTKDPETVEKVERLFRAGKDVEAKAILVNGAREMKKRRIDVERKTKEYSDKAY